MEKIIKKTWPTAGWSCSRSRATVELPTRSCVLADVCSALGTTSGRQPWESTVLLRSSVHRGDKYLTRPPYKLSQDSVGHWIGFTPLRPPKTSPCCKFPALLKLPRIWSVRFLLFVSPCLSHTWISCITWKISGIANPTRSKSCTGLPFPSASFLSSATFSKRLGDTVCHRIKGSTLNRGL